MNLKLHLNRESDELVLVQRVGRGTNSANDDGAYFRGNLTARATGWPLSPASCDGVAKQAGNGGSEQCRDPRKDRERPAVLTGAQVT